MAMVQFGTEGPIVSLLRCTKKRYLHDAFAGSCPLLFNGVSRKIKLTRALNDIERG